MAVRANPNLVAELEHYGAGDVALCYQCGNCTAACNLSNREQVFPRHAMHASQLGLEQPLRSSLEPWLCYYCGDCSEQCPRGAEPGETMMGLRRWLTAQYDFTGISRLLYRSWATELAAILVMALLTGIGFYSFGMHYGGGNLAVYDGPGAFLPAHDVHLFDWAMGFTLALLLGINALRMIGFTRQARVGVPLAEYVRKSALFPLHFLLQPRFRECENRRPWAQHLVLMLSYLTMLVLIMFFLRQVQSGPTINWYAHSLGYLASLGLVITIALALVGRIRKRENYHKHSHESDWFFLVLLLYVSLTGIAQHVLHRVGMPMAANITYIVHLMGVVPMLMLEVPFSKWSHMVYRPLAVYLAALERGE